jgi:hypothetical protein
MNIIEINDLIKIKSEETKMKFPILESLTENYSEKITGEKIYNYNKLINPPVSMEIIKGLDKKGVEHYYIYYVNRNGDTFLTFNY